MVEDEGNKAVEEMERGKEEIALDAVEFAGDSFEV